MNRYNLSNRMEAAPFTLPEHPTLAMLRDAVNHIQIPTDISESTNPRTIIHYFRHQLSIMQRMYFVCIIMRMLQRQLDAMNSLTETGLSIYIQPPAIPSNPADGIGTLRDILHRGYHRQYWEIEEHLGPWKLQHHTLLANPHFWSSYNSNIYLHFMIDAAHFMQPIDDNLLTDEERIVSLVNRIVTRVSPSPTSKPPSETLAG